ncbi:hypothetical protein [Candidatus Nitrospira bockiana]
MIPLRSLISVVLLIVLAACSASPPARIDAYLGADAQRDRMELAAISPDQLIDAGLLVLNDVTWPRSAPALSEESLHFLTDRTQQQVQEMLPIRIVKVLQDPGVLPTGNADQFVQLAKEQGLDYLLIAIFSSEESEIPLYLPLDGAPEQGGTRPKVPGFEAVNYALSELVLLDAKTGRPIAQADGRAWASLNRLYVPIKSNAYPVIHKSLRIAPIYPKEENAKDVLRSVAGDEALEQAVMHLNHALKKA